MVKKKVIKGISTRKFLNKSKGVAAIYISGSNPLHGCNITISDCNRQVTLDFNVKDWDDESDLSTREDVAKKFDLLISELEKARDWMFPPDAEE